ncbi:MAG: helix-turn-helix transcriptional regulator [Betaproteobacteria bacterium]|nr:helix-turn-helix transcriptional regulator [Betaproteobacteria bacterium]
MSRTGHPLKPYISPDIFANAPRPVVVIANDYPDGFLIPSHRHRRAQLLYPSTGVITVTTRDGSWIVPPLRAVWIPAGIHHEVRAVGRVSMRSVNITARAARSLPRKCCAVGVSPLLRELILRAAGLPLLYEEHSGAGRMMRLVLDEIHALPVLPLHLPAPEHPRLKIICDAIVARPDLEHTIEDWARRIGASPRTVARLFRSHTGMSFSAWRQQARLLEALKRLAAGEPVTSVALDLGYASPSAFISMFRRAFGNTPGRYFGAAA